MCFNAHSEVMVAALPSCGSIEFMLMALNQIVLFGDYSQSPTGSWLTACRSTVFPVVAVTV